MLWFYFFLYFNLLESSSACILSYQESIQCACYWVVRNVSGFPPPDFQTWFDMHVHAINAYQFVVKVKYDITYDMLFISMSFQQLLPFWIKNGEWKYFSSWKPNYYYSWCKGPPRHRWVSNTCKDIQNGSLMHATPFLFQSLV